jgi:lipopolysaccharide/colanic/teichoic acid biosynthesis glycosyltransferase
MYSVLKRSFDILASLFVLLVLFPFLFFVGIWILLDTKGGIFYRQTRVGKNGKEFRLLKFRSMRLNADQTGQLTVGNDERVTKSGKFIRKYKIDEFPQLLNIIVGNMSLVGPRPEVPKYVALYSEEQRMVLSVLPGLTDLATIEYIDEQQALGQSEDPEREYLEQVLPAKLALSLRYIEERTFFLDIKLLLKTIVQIF